MTADDEGRPEGMLEAVRERYAREAGSCCCLSCGQALGLADPRPGEVLVDLGSGRGTDVIRAAAAVGPAGRAIGIDMTEAMLRAARAAAGRAGLANAEFRAGALDALPVGDGEADVVISNCTINHAPDKGAVYREIHRILRPGGRGVVADIVAERPVPEAIRSDPAAWAGCYGGAIPWEEYRAAMRGAGFGEPEVLERSEPYDKGGVEVRSVTLAIRKAGR